MTPTKYEKPSRRWIPRAAAVGLAVAMGIAPWTAARAAEPWGEGPPPTLAELPPASRAFLTEMSDKSLQFFIDNYRNGVFLDKAPNGDGTSADLVKDMGSIAATGYGLAILTHAAKHGRVSPELARARLRESLQAMLDAPHHEGWISHFVTTDHPPKRFGTSEFSTIDTTLLLYGAAYAVAEAGDPESQKLFDRLVERIDWESMRTNGGTMPEKETLSMGWKDGAYERAEWSGYNETPLLVLLGIGLGKLPADSWWTWDRQYVSTAEGRIMAGGESLFMHQFMALYLGEAPVRDGFPSYFENSKMATLFNRRFSKEQRELYRGFWGLSAAPTPKDGYMAYGPSARDHDGTVCLSAALASAVFFPAEIAEELSEQVKTTGRDKLVGKYGFYEAYQPSTGWRSDIAIAISIAPIYQAIANLDPKTSFPETMAKLPFVKAALEKIAERAVAKRDMVPELYHDVAIPCAKTSAAAR
jgi:hypothetical protein